MDSISQEKMPVHSEEKKILNHSAFFYSSLYIFIIFKVLGGFLIASFLGPALYGLRNIFGLIVDYEQFSQLGTFEAMAKEVPYHRGKNNLKQADQISRVVFGANMLYALIVCVLLFVAALYLHVVVQKQVYVDFAIFLGCYIVISKIRNFYIAELIIDKKAALLSKIKIQHGFFNMLLCVGLVYYFSLRGLFIGLLGAHMISLAYIWTKVRRIPVMQLSPKIWELLKIGFPIMLIGLLVMLFISVDRIIIASLLSKKMLGYYAVATFISGLIYTSIADVSRVVFFPRLMEKLGRTNDIYRIQNYLIEPTVIIAYFTPFLVGGLYLGIHLPVKHLLPAYLASIEVVRVLALGAFFSSVATMSMLVCVALNRQLKVVYVMIFLIAINAVLSYTFITLGWGIAGVAIGTTIGYAVFSTLLIWYALRQFRATSVEYIQFIALIYTPFVYAMSLLLVIEQIFGFYSVNFLNDALLTAIKLAVFFVCFSLIFLLVKNHPAFRKLAEHMPFLPKFFGHFSRVRPAQPRQIDAPDHQ
jgi:O-antigen/teichoic acid export membrane protein